MNNALKYKNHYAFVNFSESDGVFFGKILDVDDLISFEGASIKGLKVAFKEAVEDYIDICLEMDRM